MRGYFGKDASRAQLGSGVGLSTAGIPLYVSRSLEQIQQANEVLGVITIKKTSEPSLVQICCAIWTHRETTNLSCYLACRDNQPMAVLTPKRHQIWCTTQTHRKTANLLANEVLGVITIKKVQNQVWFRSVALFGLTERQQICRAI